MWKLLKTEVNYFKWLYIISLFFVIIVNTGLTIDNRWIEAQDDFPGLRIIWLGVGIVVLFFTLLFNRKSGRLRNHILLPLKNMELALIRMLAFIVFWIILIFILFTFYIINFGYFPGQSWLINLLSISGIIFLINSIPALYTDFYSTYFSKYEKLLLIIFWSILWIIYIIMNTVFMTYLDFLSPEIFADARALFKDTYFSTGATLVNVILGLGMFLLSIASFKRRKLYFE